MKRRNISDSESHKKAVNSNNQDSTSTDSRRPFKTRGKKFFLIFKLKPQNPFSNYIVFVLRF